MIAVPALGHKPAYASQNTMSALPSKADMGAVFENVGQRPTAEFGR
jgi:hypothetical protein